MKLGIDLTQFLYYEMIETQYFSVLTNARDWKYVITATLQKLWKSLFSIFYKQMIQFNLIFFKAVLNLKNGYVSETFYHQRMMQLKKILQQII